MKFIPTEVKNFAISKSDGILPISGSKNYFGLSFKFDSEFAEIGGSKVCEFFKGRNKVRADIIDGRCMIPNEFLEDKNYFEIRVLSGNTIATPWIPINIIESGTILPEEVEELPAEYEYVKTLPGENAAPLIRDSEDGLQYSNDGINWKNALNGIPDAPKNSDGKVYVRAYGDWIEIDVDSVGGTSENAIEKVLVNGSELEVTDKAVNIDLSDYAKVSETATKAELEELNTLDGESTEVTLLSGEETDTATIVAKVNELIGIMKAGGVCS